jgi:small lipoprotein (TIGR04452 family)
MIKAFVFFIHLVIITNCIVLDKLDLSVPESVTGKEAKDIIVTAAITGAYISTSIEGRVTLDALLSFISNKLAGVKENAYYDKFDVDQCAADAQLINVITIRIGWNYCLAGGLVHALEYFWSSPF